MKAHLARLGKQTLVYGLSAAMLPAVAIITLPVFAREFAPAEFGALEIATVGMAALLVLADLGMASASQRSYYDYSEEQLAERRAVLATAALICLTTATALAVLLLGFRQPLADWLFDGRSYASLVVLVALCLPLAILATFCREVMRLRFQPWHYTTSAASAALLSRHLSEPAAELNATRRAHHGEPDALHAGQTLGHFLPVGERRFQRLNKEMAVEAQNLVQQLLAEAVHDGHHDNQRRNAEHDAEERETGNDGDEAFLATRPQIASGQQPFEGRKRWGSGCLVHGLIHYSIIP